MFSKHLTVRFVSVLAASMLAMGCAAEEPEDGASEESELVKNTEFKNATLVQLGSRNEVRSDADNFARIQFKASKGNVLRIYVPGSTNAELLKGSTGAVLADLRNVGSGPVDFKLTSSGTFFLRTRNNNASQPSINIVYLTQQNNAEHKAYMASVECKGPAVSFATFAKAMPRGAAERSLESSIDGGRKRACTPSTGCSDWETLPTIHQFMLRTTDERFEFSQERDGLANVRVGEAELGQSLENDYAYPGVRMIFKASKGCLSMTTDAPAGLSPTESASRALRFELPDLEQGEEEPAFAGGCAGAPLTDEALLDRFAPGSSTLAFASATMATRIRTCTAFTGCAAWKAPASVASSSSYSVHVATSGRLEIWSGNNKAFDLVDGTIFEKSKSIGVVTASCAGFVRTTSARTSEQTALQRGEVTETWKQLDAQLPVD